MGMLVEGLNQIRDLWGALNTAIEMGTGSTQETAQDTDLESVIAGSESLVVSSTTANQSILKEASIPSTSAGNQSVQEWIWKTTSPELASSRGTIVGALTWDISQDLIIDTEWFVRGRLG